MQVTGINRRSNRFAQLLRLLTLRGLDDPAATASDAPVAGCISLALAAWVIVDRLQWGAGVEFDAFGIATLALAALLLLALAYLMARLSRPALPMRATLLIAVAPLTLLILAAALIERYAAGRWQPLATLLLAGVVLLYAAHSLRVLSGRWQLRALLAASALLGGYLWLGQRMDLRPTLWAPPDNVAEADAPMSPQVAESLLFDARTRLDEALEKVAGSDGGVNGAGGVNGVSGVSGVSRGGGSRADGGGYSVFFVGFAGVSSQKVFAEEIKLAAHVVGERFDSDARQLLLINDHRDVDSYPLASVSALRYALAGIAGKMNLQRDVLFLALSSHGSEEPLLSVSNGILPLEQLSADELASALHDSGIRWRVIVISACHAGAFIEPLKDADTVVITAAAADRTSFGCSDDRELTYFGEAFYRDALPRAKSLQDAFALTRSAIAARERAEKVTPSDPQAYFGPGIAQRLAQQPMRAPAR
jgi:hypothetical protein